MKLILDTHAVLWAMRESSRLGTQGMSLLNDPANEVLLSAVVPWEMSIKERLGKMPEATPLLMAWPHVSKALSAVPLPITDTQGILAGRLEWAHKDPFDRMLAAQALTSGAVLISIDSIFDRLPGLVRSW
jgi:PIN domain nuclease of toxin-antitoxin system